MYFMHVDAVVVVAESSSLFLLGQQKGTHTHTLFHLHTQPNTTHYYTQATRILGCTRDVCPPATATKSELLLL